jgi:23S rRNA (uracil1939-C5)-methyltransferase
MDRSQTITVEKLVHGGQALGVLSDGRRVFVWNALPGETVEARIVKSKKDYAEAIAETIVAGSPERVEPREANYLATSPWQIVSFDAENKYKKQIVAEIFSREHIMLDDFTFTAPDSEWHYRNKMEYSFWGDDDGLHLALHQRGSHGKQIVTGSELAMPAIDDGTNALLAELRKYEVRAGDLKSVVVRCDQQGNTVASLFTKRDEFIQLALPTELKGLRVYHSNPKSPASVPTRLLYELGDMHLHDTLLNQVFTYDVDSFFQVNVPIFETVLSLINSHVSGESVIDMYGGVGSIGLSVSANPVIVELDEATVAMAKENAAGTQATVVHASTEKALEYITQEKILIVDPPRAGLHKDVVAKILEVEPKKVIYLSCNPATQARDIDLLQEKYSITSFEGFNFFPHTPHIETLAILQRK